MELLLFKTYFNEEQKKKMLEKCRIKILIKNNKQIDSYKFALDVLNLSKPIFDVIYIKLIGDNFYENQKKFPKMTMTKLKNEDFINSILSFIKEIRKITKVIII